MLKESNQPKSSFLLLEIKMDTMLYYEAMSINLNIVNERQSGLSGLLSRLKQYMQKN
jgi:hypothetical protein